MTWRDPSCVALDLETEACVSTLAGRSWPHTRFVAIDRSMAADGSHLVSPGGERSTLEAALSGVGLVVFAASNSDGAVAAATIGQFAFRHGIMTAGLAMTDEAGDGPLTTLRPYSRMLLRPSGRDDLAELLETIQP